MRNPLKVIREKWMAYLERLAKANAETFGTGRMNCCGMNENTKLKNKETQHKNL